MSIFKLYRWIFSLTLVVSLISFSGITTQNSPVIIHTELVVFNNNTTSNDAINFHAPSMLGVPTPNFIDFNFQQYLQSQTKRFSQIKTTQDIIILNIKKESINTAHIVLVSISTKIYTHIFLG